jgi:hypothetical protein
VLSVSCTFGLKQNSLLLSKNAELDVVFESSEKVLNNKKNVFFKFVLEFKCASISESGPETQTKRQATKHARQPAQLAGRWGQRN